MPTYEMETRIADLEDELRQRDDKIKELTADLGDARDLVDQMREYVEDTRNRVDNWIGVFEMERDDDGIWMFDPKQTKLWGEYHELLDVHNKLVRKWNKYAGQFNAKVAPKDLGRPLGASEAQRADVLKRHKAGDSLRAIVKATSLSLRTVRTIVEKSKGTDRTSRRADELRRMEFDRQRAAAFRARKSRREDIPKQMTAALKSADALTKRAKGLGKS